MQNTRLLKAIAITAKKGSGLNLLKMSLVTGALTLQLACGLAYGENYLTSQEFKFLCYQLKQRVNKGLIPGAVVMATRNGELVYDSVFGYQDIASRTPMNEDTLFRFYSMSKPITSVAIMMLAEKGKLKLTDPAAKFIPEFKDMKVYRSGDLENMKTVQVKNPITIRDLLTHTSGITYHFTGNTPVHQYYRKYGVKRNTPVGSLATDGAPAESLDELVRRIARAPLLHQPGTTFSYSYSTTVLGYIVEKVSGQRLDKFLQDNIFEPLGMTDTGFLVQGEALDHLVTNYLMTAKGLKAIETRNNTDYSDSNRLLDGGGALAGTAKDYLRFATMLANGGELDGFRLLQTRSVYRMFYPEVEIAGLGGMSGIQFGLGFAVGSEKTEELKLMPAGMYSWGGSGNTNFWVDPDTGLAVVLMTQVITPPGFENSIAVRRLSTQAVSAYHRRLLTTTETENLADKQYP